MVTIRDKNTEKIISATSPPHHLTDLHKMILSFSASRANSIQTLSAAVDRMNKEQATKNDFWLKKKKTEGNKTRN